VTVVSSFSVTVQSSVPLHPPPDQPVNVESVSGEAVNITAVALVKDFEHPVPHDIPNGELVTVPEPVPDLEIVSL
jgi:hypothetical protein